MRLQREGVSCRSEKGRSICRVYATALSRSTFNDRRDRSGDESDIENRAYPTSSHSKQKMKVKMELDEDGKGKVVARGRK